MSSSSNRKRLPVPADAEPPPANSTFASRRAEREAAGNVEPTRRKLALGAGENEFQILDGDPTDRVSQNVPTPTVELGEASQ